MNRNEYTHLICDRFVLLFIACIGLIGTSYIIVNNNQQSSELQSTPIGITSASTSTLNAFATPLLIKEVKPEISSVEINEALINSVVNVGQ